MKKIYDSEKSERKRIKLLAIIGAAIIFLALLGTIGPNLGERLLRRQEVETGQENDYAMTHCSSVKDCQDKIAETNRRLAAIEKNGPHDEVFLSHIMTGVYVGLGVTGLMLIAFIVVRRSRKAA